MTLAAGSKLGPNRIAAAVSIILEWTSELEKQPLVVMFI